MRRGAYVKDVDILKIKELPNSSDKVTFFLSVLSIFMFYKMFNI